MKVTVTCSLKAENVILSFIADTSYIEHRRFFLLRQPLRCPSDLRNYTFLCAHNGEFLKPIFDASYSLIGFMQETTA